MFFRAKLQRLEFNAEVRIAADNFRHRSEEEQFVNFESGEKNLEIERWDETI